MGGGQYVHGAKGQGRVAVGVTGARKQNRRRRHGASSAREVGTRESGRGEEADGSVEAGAGKDGGTCDPVTPTFCQPDP